MEDHQLLRYSRHIMLPEIDIAGQERLARSCVLVIGLGGLGSPVSIYLAAAGVGRLMLADYDIVELSNLQRQIVHTSNDIGRKKTDSAAQHIASINPEVEIEKINTALTEDALIHAVKAADVVVDASDNFNTRFALNAACVKMKTPLVSAAAIRFEGQISVFNLIDPASPCYRCLYDHDKLIEDNCTSNGVFAPLLGIIGSIQANETCKLLMGIGKTLQGSLLLVDCLHIEMHQAKLNKDPDCPVCAQT